MGQGSSCPNTDSCLKAARCAQCTADGTGAKGACMRTATRDSRRGLRRRGLSSRLFAVLMQRPHSPLLLAKLKF
jgi:hypothetical protein